MYKVGFIGGNTLVEVGGVVGMRAFFEVIAAVETSDGDTSMSEIVDRLFRRYVRLDDVARTRSVLISVKEKLSSWSTRDLAAELSEAERDQSGILFSECNVAAAFSKYFFAVERCLDASESSLKYFSERTDIAYEYEPVMVISQVPAFILDRRIPLSDYDLLDGPPYWLQPWLEKQEHGS